MTAAAPQVNADLTEIVVLLDRSGSMLTIKGDMEQGFDSYIAQQRLTPGACVVTLVEFDSQGIETVYEAKPVAEVPKLALYPRGGTPLLDAMGTTIDNVGARLGRTPADRRPGKLLFLVITDGEENQSRTFRRSATIDPKTLCCTDPAGTRYIKDMVEHQTNVYKWTFSFIGANLDAFAEAGHLGIAAANSANYVPDSGGVRAAFSAVSIGTDSLRGGGGYHVRNSDDRVKQFDISPAKSTQAAAAPDDKGKSTYDPAAAAKDATALPTITPSVT